ncbi:related to enoyl-CoA hydratase/isomerase [Phialocephala subalpina]|uniref:Related to enoyl-CoA hydratase/isomerase n=1 Tax=Phialocephala subalpina TaxID=576137 RepID=A0A1L7XWF1_9HELO|nr:related to enoyl-CoA hydratase/isomerase [Phialocephala subalpina]
MLYGILDQPLGRGLKYDPDTEIPDLNGKIIIVTGGTYSNVGLGKETILRLSKHSPKQIYLLARTQSKAEAAIKDLQSAVPKAPISFIQCDLTDLKSVEAAAKDFTSKEKKLDILYLNAGIMATPPGLTKDGYEIQFGTNHVGHALLTKLLLPTLEKTAEQAADVRVIAVSSVGHVGAPWSGICFDKLKTEMSWTPTMVRYGQSKLANILFARELAKRYPKILAVSIHPGAVNTELYRSVFNGWLSPLNRIRGGFDTVETGAKNQLWAGTVKREDVTNGEYYTPVAMSGQGSWNSQDMALAAKLWEWTENELAGYEPPKAHP